MFIHCTDGIPKTFVVGALFFSGNYIAFYVVLEMFKLVSCVYVQTSAAGTVFLNVHIELLQTLSTNFELYNSPIGIDMVHQQS